MGPGLFTAAMALSLGRNNITTPYLLTWITRGAESGERISVFTGGRQRFPAAYPTEDTVLPRFIGFHLASEFLCRGVRCPDCKSFLVLGCYVITKRSRDASLLSNADICDYEAVIYCIYCHHPSFRVSSLLTLS